MNHTTKFNRITTNKPLLEAYRFAKESLYLSGQIIRYNVAKGISHTCYPDGSVKIK